MRININTLLEYKASFILGILSSLLYIFISFLFWGTIYSYTKTINGWTFGQVMLVQGFFAMFLAFFWSIFHFSEHMDKLIIYGGLDRFLVRPMNPLVAYMFEMFSVDIFGRLFSTIVFFWIALQLGASMNIMNFAAAVVMVFLSSAIFALILVALSSLAFWIGKMESVIAVFDLVWNISDYPITIFPVTAQILMTFGIPLAFMQTYPTLFTMQQLNLSYFLQLIVIEILLIFIWLQIATFVWNKGLKRYSSYGG